MSSTQPTDIRTDTGRVRVVAWDGASRARRISDAAPIRVPFDEDDLLRRI